MGILFNTNTWRAPLQLIDCWLPAPAKRRTLAANEPLANHAVQRFARAGWLGRPPARAALPSGALMAHTKRSENAATSRVRVLRQPEPLPSPSLGVRLVISGRINDVCAELDRLADQESQVSARAA